MGAAEDLVNNTSGAAEIPVNHNTDATENPINSKEGAAEIPLNDKTSSSENPVNHNTEATENPINGKEGATEVPLNDKASSSENPVNHITNATENPINGQEGATEIPLNDKASSSENLVNHNTDASENPINGKEGATEIPVIEFASSSENPVNHNTNATEHPLNDKEDATEIPLNDKASSSENPGYNRAAGAENPASDQSDGAVNLVNDEAGDVESPLNNQSDSAVNPVNDQAGGAESSAKDQAGCAVNPAKDKACGADSPSNDQSDEVLNTVNVLAGDAENLANDQDGGAEDLVNDTTGGTENLVNDKAVAAENAINDNDKAGAAENDLNDRAGGAQDPVSDTPNGVEISVNDKAGAAENGLNDKAGDVKDPEDDKADDVKDLVDDKAGDVKDPVNKQADAAGNPVNDKEGAAVEEDDADAVETPVSSNADCLPVEAKEILKSLAGKWEDVLDENALQVIALKGAMTNEVFQIKWPTTTGEPSRKVLVRIYGQGVDIFFDRADEIRTFEFMSKNGQGPRLLGRFSNGRVEEFIHARTLSASDLCDPSISALIAAKMKEFHDIDMPGEKKVYLWDRLRNWLSEAKQLSSPQEVEAFYLDTVDKEISILEKELSGAHQRIGFCHNDLQYGNIMLDEETNSVTIIDYEYASYNPVAYDIANHFCEMAADYHTEAPHILDYDKYPDFEERQRFVLAYLSSSGEQPSYSEVEQLLQEVEKYTLANHLFWGIWGIISAQVNKIDFDYKEYAKQRFQEYWARKPYLLISSDAPSPYNVPEGTGELASASTSKTSTKNIFRKMKRVLGLGLFRSKS